VSRERKSELPIFGYSAPYEVYHKIPFSPAHGPISKSGFGFARQVPITSCAIAPIWANLTSDPLDLIPMNTIIASVCVSAIGFGLCALGGCTSQQLEQVTLDTAGVIEVQSALPTKPAPEAQSSMWQAVIAELDLQFDLSAQRESTTGSNALPQLIAGDWLAMECAISGGYWDWGQERGTPVFAEVPESWSVPE